MIRNLVADARHGVRILVKSPGFTAIAILTLALGIGANTAIFSVVNAVILRPFAYPHPEQLVSLIDANPKKGFSTFSASPPNYFDWRDQNEVFASVAAYYKSPGGLIAKGDAKRIDITLATPNIFATLGVSPIVGRGFTLEEGSLGHDHSIVLSHRLWQQSYASDPNILGQTTKLDGEKYTIVGVMPADFTFPIVGSDAWVPLAFNSNVQTQRGAHYLSVIARLKPGIAIERAQQNMSVIAGRLETTYPKSNDGWTVIVKSLNDSAVGKIKSALLMLFGAVGFVALIACANTANLLLARAVDRAREMAIRSALGATRTQLVRQLLIESMLMSLAGGMVALLIGYWAIDLIVKLGPQNIPRLDQVSLDLPVMIFTITLSVGTGLLFGLLPAVQNSRADLANALKSSSLTSSGDREKTGFRSALVVSELTLSLVLLAGAGLLIRSFLRLQAVEPGFDSSHVLVFNLSLPSQYSDSSKIAAFQDSLFQELQRLPGVQSTGAMFILPFSGHAFSSSYKVQGQPENDESFQVRPASAGFFSALKVPLIKGRMFTDADRLSSTRVVLLSQSAAKTILPDGDVIGRQIEFSARIGLEKLSGTVVGVVGDVRDRSLDAPAPLNAFVPLAQAGLNEFNVVLRTAGDPASLAPVVQQIVHKMDKELPIADMSTLDDVVAQSLSQRRFYMALLTIFAAIALLLASLGVYGVIAYSVSRRTREIGIRLALGAQQTQVLRLVVAQAMKLIVPGIVAGVAGAVMLSNTLESLLFGVKARDAVNLAAVAAVLLFVAVIASYLPARRASRIDPIVALRYD